MKPLVRKPASPRTRKNTKPAPLNANICLRLNFIRFLNGVSTYFQDA